MIAINAMLADSLEYVADFLDKEIAAGTEFHAAVQKLLEGIITEHGKVVFNGNGYSDEWQEEAASRGLLNLRTTVDAMEQYDLPEIKEVFSKYGILSERELEARKDVVLEQYSLALLVEAKETLEIAKTMILPAATRYMGELASTAASLKAAGIEMETPALGTMTGKVSELNAAMDLSLIHI